MTTLLPAGSPATVRIFTTLLTEGELTRGEVAVRTGFSAGAVTKGLQPLLAAGLVREGSETERSAGAGRPAWPLRVAADHAFVIGIKVTADELIAVLTDLRADVIATRHVPLPARAVGHAHLIAPDAVVRAAAEVVTELRSHADGRVAGLGVAVSGDVDARAGVVRFSPLLGWTDVALAEQLAERTGLPVRLENDVRALAVAEQWFGAGVGAPSFALVTVGTGIGSALVVDGRLVTGAHGVAGELGHLSLDPAGPACHCGGTGCVEALVGEAALLDAVAAAGVPVATLADALAAADRPGVRAVFAAAGTMLGRALAAVANLIGPRRIVLTGELLAGYELIEPTLTAAFAAQSFGAARCEIVVRPLRFEHWARGAAAATVAGLVTAG